MKIFFIGGHITPAFSVIESLSDEHEPVIVGRKNTFEQDKGESYEYLESKKRGIRFINLYTGRLSREISAKSILSFFKIPFGILHSLFLILKERPDVIVGFGGYLQFPVIISASFLGIPSVIHEQTFNAGLSNKLSSFFASRVCISWEQSVKYFPKRKTVLTGLPIRRAILKINKGKSNARSIYITGGSGGSHFINSLVKDCLLELTSKYNLYHQCGNSQEFNDYELLVNSKNKLPEEQRARYTPFKFFSEDELVSVYKECSLVIGRSGANTCAELIYLEKPALFIPLRVGQKGEQEFNALYLKDVGLSESMAQDDLNKEMFLHTIDDMFKKINNYKINKKYDFTFLRNSADNIIRVIEDVAKKTKDKK